MTRRLNDMGKFGSYVEILILFERWVGHRLLPEKTVPTDRRMGRNIATCALLVSERVQIE